jgi:hypothetical protein
MPQKEENQDLFTLLYLFDLLEREERKDTSNHDKS